MEVISSKRARKEYEERNKILLAERLSFFISLAGYLLRALSLFYLSFNLFSLARLLSLPFFSLLARAMSFGARCEKEIKKVARKRSGKNKKRER